MNDGGKNVFNLISSESVTEGHPDKVADRVSDAILDSILTIDPYARVAAEALLTTGMVLVAGEVTTVANVDFEAVIRDAIAEVGFTNPAFGFSAYDAAVIIMLKKQSADIAAGVLRDNAIDPLDRIGAGDQGIMFGYACDETPDLMPLPITLAHSLTRRLAEARKTNIIPYLRPDGKAQVTVAYDGDTPQFVNTIVVSTQHDPDVTLEQIRNDIMQHVIRAAIPNELITRETKFHINPTGRFVTGGPQGDVGLTGRKIIVDTYGGAAPHGGGAFSGKDPTKVDRSAGYYARTIAKHVVNAKLATRAQVQIAYAIGVPKPVSIHINTLGTGVIPDHIITEAAQKTFDARPAAIIQQLNLRQPIYTPTAAYGHFGRKNLPWEHTDQTKDLFHNIP
jgi:S-adenosylmethionine synthetase